MHKRMSMTLFIIIFAKFSCGTMVIASSMNHLVCDLQGFLDFVELWARLTRGEQVDYTKIPDDWTRTPQRFFAPHSGKLMVPPGIMVGDSSQDTVQVAPAPSTTTRWHVPAAKVAQLKRDLAPDDDEMWISTSDALTVLISGAVTRARETSKVERQTGQVGFTRRTPADHSVETIVIVADIREQALRGDMANGRYFGNACIALVVPVSRADLMSPTATAASRAAVAIRNHIKQRLSQKEISGHLAFLENPGILVPGRTFCVTDIFVSNWCKFDLDGPKLDFGWGKPSHYTDGNGTETSLPPAISLIRQKKDSGDVFMLITVEVPGADALKNDPLLTKYGELL
ncbi:transferase [Gongronella butleri]|nr:transferase [Gongronella butleri]